jgi:UDP-N-acetylmuramyl pentapeptide phosphotransferase/UDP-N-acetylglucosamine-1-phosphate transferase
MSLIIAFPVAFLLTWAARYLGFATGMVDRPAATPSPSALALKIHARPIPILGGVAVMATVVASLFAVHARMPVLVTAGVAVATLVGLADDIRPLPASSRMLALAGAGVLLAVFVRWANAGFGPLGDEYPTALGVTLFGLGVQTIFGSFFIGLLTMRTDREPVPETVVLDERIPERVARY